MQYVASKQKQQLEKLFVRATGSPAINSVVIFPPVTTDAFNLKPSFTLNMAVTLCKFL